MSVHGRMSSQPFSRRDFLKIGGSGVLLAGVASQTVTVQASPSEVLPPDSSELFAQGVLNEHNFAESSFTEDQVGTDVSDFELAHADTSNVEDMNLMFYFAELFDQDIGGWDTSNVEDMRRMFYHAESFDQDISEWCVEQITGKPDMFDFRARFEGDDAKQPNWGSPC